MFEWKIEELSNLRPIEAMINLERNKALDESWEHDCTYFSLVADAPIETIIYPKRNKGASETLKGDRAYLSAMTDESN